MSNKFKYSKLILQDITSKDAESDNIIFALDYPEGNSRLFEIQSIVVDAHYILQNQNRKFIGVAHDNTEAKKRMYEYLKREILNLNYNVLEDRLNFLEI